MIANAPVGSVGNGGVALSPNGDDRMARFFDDLAIGLESNAVSRAKLIKLGGAALVASALGLFTSVDPVEAETQDDQTLDDQTFKDQTLHAARIRHHTQDCCLHLRHRRILGIRVPLPGCVVCCRRRGVACCGRHGCHCCLRGHCHRGRCRRRHRRRRRR
jgi:hypothetical protein